MSLHKILETEVDGVSVTSTSVGALFGGMSWPSIGKHLTNLQWRFRYDPKSITESDMAAAAGILCAYRDIVRMPARQRAHIVSVLRAVYDTGGSGDE